MSAEGVLEQLVWIHATLGSVALLSGFLSLVARKGSKAHKKSGYVFIISMFASIVFSLIVSVSPTRFNPFLFSIGLFSLYFLIMGIRSIKYKSHKEIPRKEAIIPLVMGVLGVGMILMSFVLGDNTSYVLLAFGSIALGISFSDTRYLWYRFSSRSFLARHLTYMIAGYISAVTAFLVVNQILPGTYLNWFVPTVLGSTFITYWRFKLKKQINQN